MTLLKRRSVLSGMVSTAILGPSCTRNETPLTGITHEIHMFTNHPENRRKMNVFDPTILKINPGDVVTFIPDIADHSTQSTPGMIPKKAKHWKGVFGENILVTFTIPGIYGYHCLAHGVIGMVGLIIVTGDGMTHNLAAAKEVSHPVLAQRNWDAIWKEVEMNGLLKQR